MVYHTLGPRQFCMPKLVLEISNLSVSKIVIQIIATTQELVCDTFESPYDDTPKMMLLAL